MHIKHFLPSDALKPYIKGFKIIESEGGCQNRILPNTSIALAFCYQGNNSYVSPDGDILLSSQTVTGLRKTPRIIRYLPNTSTLIVLFKEGQASHFFKEPLHELFEHSVPMASILPRLQWEAIEDSLRHASSDAVRVACVEHYLLQRLGRTHVDRLVQAAIERIVEARGIINIRDLASTLCISTDAFEKRFRRTVGASPKQYCFIIRMSSVIHRKSASKLTEAGLDAGFYDQSHFNKNFKTFTGLQPSHFELSRFW